ncbi:hypothetical protein BDR03DRAFT_1003196 [Suillus americanus]|nr:hypothetical protein BDR03DRAFT_1003196 [Suillus americanus]
MSTQYAVWLPGVGEDFVVGPREINAPGPCEHPVKIVSSGLNPLDWVIQEEGFTFFMSYLAIIGEEAAGTVETVGDGVADFNFFKAYMSKKFSTFQQYCTMVADLAVKVLLASYPPSLPLTQPQVVNKSEDKVLYHVYGNFYAPPNRKLGKGSNAVEVVPNSLKGVSSDLQRQE